MTLEKRLEDIPDEVANEDLDELRRALIRTQKQLKDARQRTDELVVATKQSACGHADSDALNATPS